MVTLGPTSLVSNCDPGDFLACDFGYLVIYPWICLYFSQILPFGEISWTQEHTEDWALVKPFDLADGKDRDFGSIPARRAQAAKTI